MGRIVSFSSNYYILFKHQHDIDDTCVQEGYWTTVAEFVAALGQLR
jgi:hypothetical protein